MGKTIAELKTEPETLWHFINQLPVSFEAQLLYGLVIAGLAGMVANYAVKWARNEIEGNLWEYLFTQNVRATLLSFFGFVSLAITSIGTGIFTSDGGVFVGWANVFWFGLTNGFAVDAVANKGKTAVWSQEKRLEKKLETMDKQQEKKP